MRILFFCPALFLLALAGSVRFSAAAAEVNSWMPPTNGQWHDANWSLGRLPGPGQSIQITNEGWKAVSIGSVTSRDHPETLTVDSLTLSSPPDSFNTLLMNYAGLETPLTLRSFQVHSNTALTLLRAAVHLNGPPDTGLAVGGAVYQGDHSIVTGSQVNVGYTGPGAYYFSNGWVDVQHLWLGGAFGGLFTQEGGTNSSGIVHLDGTAQYHLRGGTYAVADTYFNNGNVFRQTGGTVLNGMRVWRGTYLLEAGVNRDGLSVPVSDGWSDDGGRGVFLQLGGTNYGAMDIGFWGAGSATLSNGVIITPSLSVGPRGSFRQSGGTVTVNGPMKVAWDWIDRGGIGRGDYELNRGSVSARTLEVGGHLVQSGGDLSVAGELLMGGPQAEFDVAGGELHTKNLTVNPSAYGGGFRQSDGRVVITNQLTISGDSYVYQWFGFTLAGGQLTVSNISLRPLGLLIVTNGALTQLGSLEISGAALRVGYGTYDFGPLRLGAADSGGTNSVLMLTGEGESATRFADSRSEPWSGAARLIIENWASSPFGGGVRRVQFGDNAAALTAAQLSQIYFRDPEGQPEGLYPAQMLSSGELAPDALPPTGRIPPRLTIRPESGEQLRVTLTGDPNVAYDVQSSGNLFHWNTTTNLSSPSGISSMLVPASEPYRFFRARAAP